MGGGRTCPGSPTGAHRWEFGSSRYHARCLYCETERDFNPVIDPLKRDKLTREDSAIIKAATVEKRRATIKAKKAKEENKVQRIDDKIIPAANTNTTAGNAGLPDETSYAIPPVIPTEPEKAKNKCYGCVIYSACQSPAKGQNVPDVDYACFVAANPEPDRKKDFTGWLDFHKAEIIADYRAMGAVEWRKRWFKSYGKEEKIARARFDLHKQKTRTKKPAVNPPSADAGEKLPPDTFIISRSVMEKLQGDLEAATAEVEDLKWLLEKQTVKLPTWAEVATCGDAVKLKWLDVFAGLNQAKAE